MNTKRIAWLEGRNQRLEGIERSEYVAIIVHKDVLKDARQIVNELALDIDYDGRPTADKPRLRALRDLVDPLPEPDVNGVMPMIIGEVNA